MLPRLLAAQSVLAELDCLLALAANAPCYLLSGIVTNLPLLVGVRVLLGLFSAFATANTYAVASAVATATAATALALGEHLVCGEGPGAVEHWL